MVQRDTTEDYYGREVDHEAVAARRLIKYVREGMKDAWREDPLLLENLFPVEPRNRTKFLNVKARNYSKFKAKKRWAIPAAPKAATGLYRPLRLLLNDILKRYGIPPVARVILDTHSPSKSVVSHPPSILSPTLYLAGAGDEFANVDLEGPQADTPSGICPIEVILDSDELVSARDRLAAYVHSIFQNQDNRRFAFGLIFTETTFTLYMFDHSGAVSAPPCDYHRHPEQFCTVISSLASLDGARIGFDLSFVDAGHEGKIRTYISKPDGLETLEDYTIKATLFQFRSLVGRGTMCWLVSGLDGSPLVIKDAWIATEDLPGKESEGRLLCHAQSCGVVLGIPQVRHFENVRRTGDDPLDLDTVLRNRHVVDPGPSERTLDRVHTRVVLATYGRTLDMFQTKMELLLAFYDAVCAHRQLHDVAGILHRDISVRNILINSEGVEGNCGILIDFDHAIRVGDTSPYSTKPKIGTWRYMSRNAMEAVAPHTYLDDLESFYYVLCWILVAYESPGTLRANLPQSVEDWDHPAASFIKHGFFQRSFSLPISSWFGNSLRDLVGRLHAFITLRFDDIGEPSSPLDPTTDYETFLSHIRRAMIEMEGERELPVSVPPIPAGHGPSGDKERSSLDQPRRHRRRQRSILIPLRKRPRRAYTCYE